MEDDEEFSYTGYSARSESEFAEREAAFVDNDEVFSYSGYADDIALTEGAARQTETRQNTEIRHSYGDYLVEEFSAVTNASRVAKITKLPQNTATYFVAAVYFVVGVLCVSITSLIAEVLPYIVGGMMTLIGLIRLIVALCRREFRNIKTNKTASSLLLALLGGMILFQQIDAENDPIMLISVIWGVIGLLEASHAFNHAFVTMFKSWKCLYFLLRGIIECAVAFILLYQPLSHSAHFLHIVVFGANLILDAITMIPPVKNIFDGNARKKDDNGKSNESD